MTPVLLNLFACLVLERWSSSVAGVEGVGTCLLHKFERKLFRRSVLERQMPECQFADDAALLANTRAGAE